MPGGGDHFGCGDAVVVDRVDLHRGRLAEMRKDLVVREGKCDFHDVSSRSSLSRTRLRQLAAAASRAVAARFLPTRLLAQPIVAAFDHERPTVDDRVGDLETGALVDLRYRGARDLHLARALLVRALVEVDDAYDLVLIDGKNNGLRLVRASALLGLRCKPAKKRFGAYAPAAARSGHDGASEDVGKKRFRLMSET